ncbi:MAG: PadR family transcriptional regulator [Actinobacteria bacterium]|nr:PadR family transcriptional regulator [Actinomycetota bacterium]
MSRELNPTAASLLGFLHDGPMSGWDLVAAAQERIGEFWSLTQSQVYRELARMDDDGLVVAGERGTRSRRVYEITDAGRRAFVEWVSRPPGTETIRFPLLLTLAFGRHVPGERLASFLLRHRIIHADRLASYEKQRGQIPPGYEEEDPFAVATLEFGITYERAVLGWFDGLPETLTDPGRPT